MSKVFIIAEAGVNHNGQLDLAIEMVDIAAEAGADSVKFQTFKSELEITSAAEKADYQKLTSGDGESLLAMAKKLELSDSDHLYLRDYCISKNILFLSTPFESRSIDFLDSLGMPIFKVSSGQVTNLPFLRKIGRLRKELIVSTGMATMEEIGEALNILVAAGTEKEKITLLHCTTAYPTPYDDANLLAMHTIRNAYGVKVGYSDHTLGIEVPIAAVALGASVIEKHFTLSCNMEGPDHKASIEPRELIQMVSSIRNIEKALGDGLKIPKSSEIVNTQVARRCIVANRLIKKGEIISEESITVKSPATGLSPMLWDSVVGSVAIKDFEYEQAIEI